ncbi:MAG: hypothetical protein JOY54_13760 [Acidobacteriaceae bacterium]|nr:hypothetical protein [Acidobacteriaceae bacterium]
MYSRAKFLANIALGAILPTIAGFGESAVPSGAALSAGIAEANAGAYDKMQSFVCSERIDRFAGKTGAGTAHHLDTIRAKVSFENGQEHYSEVTRDKRSLPGISSVAGAWSEGEFGTLLHQTEESLRSKPIQFEREGEINGTAAAEFHFDVAEQDSPWDLIVAGRHYRVPFRAEVWVAKFSREIIKVSRKYIGDGDDSLASTNIAELKWSLTLAPIEMKGKRWLLPKDGEYSVEYKENGHREWNELTFFDYHRYGAEATVRFSSEE